MPDGVERQADSKQEIEATIEGRGTVRAKATISRTAPRVAPEKAWDSGKPPGGKIPAKSE